MRLGIGRGAERSQPDYRVRRTKGQFMLTTPPKATPSDSSRQIGYGGQPTRKVPMDPCLVSILFAEYTPGTGQSLDFFVSHVQVSREIRCGVKWLVTLKLPHTARRLACHIFHQ